ncbi:hypothetical protein NOK12_17590 [Nocardioides sp. OK12]|uniref:hypothetical protein n=1 Tax=Nocardioides sp. OK12 TaxID=2758661 RepID=UPI0021C2C7B1|nr:hypothetical protein [Nocardioides sp. OK12]GHJ59241.1 hypothetical protein NOK12_17590 [Nocardioides sp. OK12]
MTSDETDPHDPAAGTTSRVAAPGFRLALAAVLVVLLVAGVVVVGYVVATRSSSADGNLAERVSNVAQGRNEIQEEREQVMEVASQFMLRVNTYGPDLLDEDGRMPEYRELVSELITAKFRTEFEESVGTAEQTVAQAGLGRTSEVYAVGVSTLDADSATALVAGQFTNSFAQGDDAERAEGTPSQYRVRVELVRVEGEWQVDDFAPVTGQGVLPAEPTEPGDGSGSGDGSDGSDGGEQ